MYWRASFPVRNIAVALYKLLHLCLREIMYTLYLHNSCMGNIAAIGRDLQAQQFSDCRRTAEGLCKEKGYVKPKVSIFVSASWDTVYSRSYCRKMRNATLNQIKILAHGRKRGDSRRAGTRSCTKGPLQDTHVLSDNALLRWHFHVKHQI